MIEFKHSDTGSIRCPFHNRRESFAAGIIQPSDHLLVRYPCSYVGGLTPTARPERVEGRIGRDELVQELSNRLQRIEERQVPRRTPPRIEPPSRPSKGGVAL